MQHDFYSWQSLPLSFMHWVTQVRHRDLNPGPQIERQTTYQLSYPSPLLFSIWLTLHIKNVYLFQMFTHVLQMYELHVLYTWNTTHVLHMYHTRNIHVANLLLYCVHKTYSDLAELQFIFTLLELCFGFNQLLKTKIH